MSIATIAAVVIAIVAGGVFGGLLRVKKVLLKKEKEE
jgi:hypothetical protein